MTSRLALLCLLTACGTTSNHVLRRQLRDGVAVESPPVFVTPGYTPAGAVLPEYHPMEEAPAVERSPHSRVLPQTPSTRKEPGLWSGDARAAARTDDEPLLIGERLPYPDGAVDELSRKMARACANLLNQSAHAVKSFDYILRRPNPIRRCIVANLYYHCAEGMNAVHLLARRAGEHHDPVEAERVRSTMARAKAMMDIECAGIELQGDDARALTETTYEWEALMTEGPRHE